jgi:hypothetical protein
MGFGISVMAGEFMNEGRSMIGSWIFSWDDSGVEVAARYANSVSGTDFEDDTGRELKALRLAM